MNKLIKEAIKLGGTGQRGVYFLNTTQELKDFYLDGLKKYKQWKAIASIEDWLPVDDNFFQDFRKKLDERKIKTKVIFKKSGIKYEPKGLKYREVKVIPASYKFRSSVDILDDKLLIMNPRLKTLGLVIDMKPMLDVFHDTFDLLWATLPKTEK